MKDILFDPPTDFAFQPADFVPFKDRALCERLRKLSGKDLEKHPNPDFHIKVMMNPHPVLIATLFARIRESAQNGRKPIFPWRSSSTISRWTAATYTFSPWTNGPTIKETSPLKPTRRVLRTPC